ncbi:hypothetical protein B484DRAFT_447047 [Ochromonadaceae sp. CCMP2298]|nr:hypothetical protein B484DRAFT_447047 [Ochromonadaceae sp. CCMP2298]
MQSAQRPLNPNRDGWAAAYNPRSALPSAGSLRLAEVVREVVQAKRRTPAAPAPLTPTPAVSATAAASPFPPFSPSSPSSPLGKGAGAGVVAGAGTAAEVGVGVGLVSFRSFEKVLWGLAADSLQLGTTTTTTAGVSADIYSTYIRDMRTQANRDSVRCFLRHVGRSESRSLSRQMHKALPLLQRPDSRHSTLQSFA